MLSKREVFISVYRLKSGVMVKAQHRNSGIRVQLDCVGSADGSCNPNQCERDLREMALEELSEKVSLFYKG